MVLLLNNFRAIVFSLWRIDDIRVLQRSQHTPLLRQQCSILHGARLGIVMLNAKQRYTVHDSMHEFQSAKPVCLIEISCSMWVWPYQFTSIPFRISIQVLWRVQHVCHDSLMLPIVKTAAALPYMASCFLHRWNRTFQMIVVSKMYIFHCQQEHLLWQTSWSAPLILVPQHS